MSKQEVEALDPQQRLLLEVVYETFQNAGAKHFRGEEIGCYVATFEGDWFELDGRDTQMANSYRLTGYGDYMAANRISYEFGLKGPKYVFATSRLDTASNITQRCHNPDCLLVLTDRAPRCV